MLIWCEPATHRVRIWYAHLGLIELDSLWAGLCATPMRVVPQTCHRMVHAKVRVRLVVEGFPVPPLPPLTSKHLTVLPTTQQHMTSHFMCVFAGSIWGCFYSAIGCSETKPRATLKSRKLYNLY